MHLISLFKKNIMHFFSANLLPKALAVEPLFWMARGDSMHPSLDMVFKLTSLV